MCLCALCARKGIRVIPPCVCVCVSLICLFLKSLCCGFARHFYIFVSVLMATVCVCALICLSSSGPLAKAAAVNSCVFWSQVEGAVVARLSIKPQGNQVLYMESMCLSLSLSVRPIYLSLFIFSLGFRNSSPPFYGFNLNETLKVTSSRDCVPESSP